jgi:hypothetical protein
MVDLRDDHEDICWTCSTEIDDSPEAMVWRPPEDAQDFWYEERDVMVRYWEGELPPPAKAFTHGPEYPTKD